MKLEFGFQSNCSELVTCLGIVDRDEVLRALKTISRLTGWNWGVNIYSKEIKGLIPVPNDRLDEVLVVYTSGRVFRKTRVVVDPEKVVSIWEGSIVEKQIEYLRDEFEGGWLHLCLYDGPVDRILRRADYRVISLAFGWEHDWRGLSFCIDSADVGLMPQFHAITREFDSDFGGHDGGTEEFFALWLAFHFLDKEESIELIKELEGPSEVDAAVSRFEANPPVNPSPGLTKKEHDAVSRQRLYAKRLRKSRLKSKRRSKQP